MMPELHGDHRQPPYVAALLKAQRVARRALRQLDELCQQYPDPELRNALDALHQQHEPPTWHASGQRNPLAEQ